MANILFLYVDILGFSELIKQKERVQALYLIIDKAALHQDSNYNTIVFSDTIVAYNKYSDLSGEAKRVELMYLIELTQELFKRLIGSGIFFRAVITEGDFTHTKLKNLEAYYGEALVDTYRAEKGLVGTGLYLDKKLRPFNTVFKFKQFSDRYDFIYLTHVCSGLMPWLARNVDNIKEPDYEGFPISGELLTEGPIDSLVYPELVHFYEIHREMNEHPDPSVRAKFLSTWNMYCLGYPGLMRSLEDHEFSPDGLAKIDWSEAKKIFEVDRA